MKKRITWLIRPDGGGPMPILPAETLGTDSIAVGSTRLMSHLSPSILNAKGPIYYFLQKSTVGRWLTSKYWDLLTYSSDKNAGHDKGDNVSALKPELDKKR